MCPAVEEVWVSVQYCDSAEMSASDSDGVRVWLNGSRGPYIFKFLIIH